MRLRKLQGKLKVEHSIIDGVRDVLERLLGANPGIRSVIPGVIRPVRDAKGEVKIRVTVPVTNGWKAIAFSAGYLLFPSWESDQLRDFRIGERVGKRRHLLPSVHDLVGDFIRRPELAGAQGAEVGTFLAAAASGAMTIGATLVAKQNGPGLFVCPGLGRCLHQCCRTNSQQQNKE